MEGKVVNMGSDQEIEGYDDYRYCNYKVLIFEDLGVRVLQDWRLGKGGILWDASWVMAKYLQSMDLENKRVIELGAGSGLPSIVSCSKGANVVVTDLPELTQFTQANFEQNLEVLRGSYAIQDLDWQNEDHREALKGHYDLMVLSDLFYLPSLAEDFSKTVRALASEHTTIVMTYRFRVPHILDPFLEELEKHYHIKYNDDFVRSIHRCENIHFAELCLK